MGDYLSLDPDTRRGDFPFPAEIYSISCAPEPAASASVLTFRLPGLRLFSIKEGTSKLISTADFRNGLTISLNGDVYQIIEFQHVKPGKGGAFVRTRLRQLRSGKVLDRTFRAGERMEQALLERKPLEFLYSNGDEFIFMDTETFDQMTLQRSTLGEQALYLKENVTVTVVFHDDEIIGVELPHTVEVKVVQTDPGLKGDTATGGNKPARVETGATVTVPLFINEGDVIRVDTRSGEYLERASGA
jgi:elongation factor P